ncbi:hypothetical protein VitviT2T_008489 [Vitis vinifera]|uniref:Reverse transcriptase Ty1/copia-type domain-containing protein n=1 Tax=Vitis vinifera TaxID=29760 RepID=A0ABY9C3K3_VITVI|nr:hypothetical protein VitviT2T_008489 [Vitis vinifera]
MMVSLFRIHLCTAALWGLYSIVPLPDLIRPSTPMEQPPGFISATNPGYVCKLNKALYGLKQSPHAWYIKISTYLLQCGFQGSKSNTSVFFSNKGFSIIILLIYVDDIIIIGSHSDLVNSLIDQLHNQFALKDLGYLSYFLGIQVTRTPSSLHLCQHKYIVDLLHRGQMFDYKHASTPMSTSSSLSLYDGEPLSDPFLYCSIVGALQYCTIT